VSTPLRVEITDGVARLTLDRPDVGNAIDVPLARALREAAGACAADGAVRCVVLTGAGRLFCAGGDVAAMRAAGDDLPALLQELIETLHEAILILAAMPKPLVTLVNGPAAGAGFSLALLGDIVLSARAAHYTPAYGAIGLTADGGLSWLLPRLVGLRRAQEILLTNRRVKAEEAEAIGLVTRLVEDAALDAEGQAVATRLADGPVAATGAVRALLQASFERDLAGQLAHELVSMTDAAGAEAKEGLAAFFGKRPANFRGAP
jgi:2-(1,2-epoxy-1,2-dihydrophenyl)acetyl-CoA isomerase